ncbi:chemotaxis protein CheC [Ammoniphilus resinae]|uniref:Chemotaxis protein CheC n=1 Tax=Ammoniphilus resinae TaxID=861532 RepID=A0ABS4GML6_9BACL|nr:chemotaxis protein CheC [Ammoniphilus resinae]MBP1931517.1 chemotaxis protein CheC [Ammoniphilus resinae]
MTIKWNGMGEIHLDVLKEVGNIGAGNAATALSKLISRDIDMKVPHARIVHFDQITELVGGPDAVVVAILLHINGDVQGSMFFILNEASAKELVKELLPTNDQTPNFTDLEFSALQEIGNILIGSYLTSLIDFTQLNMYHSVPSLAIDMAGAIVSYGLIELSQVGDYAMVIDTSFLDGSKEVEGHFFFLPDPESLNKIFRALGVPLDECH